MGKETWKCMVSRVMPRNSRDIEGPSIFARENGPSSSVKTDFMSDNPWAGGAFQEEMTRKLSRRCNQTWQFMVVGDNPRQGFREWDKQFMAVFATTTWLFWQNLESTCDVGFWKPGTSGGFYKESGMVHCGVFYVRYIDTIRRSRIFSWC